MSATYTMYHNGIFIRASKYTQRGPWIIEIEHPAGKTVRYLTASANDLATALAAAKQYISKNA